MQRKTIFGFNFLIAILAPSMAIMPVFAQAYNDNYDPARSNVMFYPPSSNPTQGVLPPPGSGEISPGVTPGDLRTSKPPVPSGSSSTKPQYGTYFEHQSQSFRSRVNLLVSRGQQTINGTSADRGTRVALTFQPDEIPDSKRSQIEGLLGGQSFSNEPYQNIEVNDSTLEEIENILYPPAQPSGSVYPYPGTPGDNIRNTPWTERSYIAADNPADRHPRNGNNEIKSPRKPIRDFSLYLVIGGVVVACVQIVIAGTFMTYGQPYAGGKAIAAAGGLMLLLMAFAIWKIDMVNVLAARGQSQGDAPDSFDVRNPPVGADAQVTGAHRYTGDMTLSPDKKSEAEQDVTHPVAQLPAIPVAATGQAVSRCGLPLLPLGAAH